MLNSSLFKCSKRRAECAYKSGEKKKTRNKMGYILHSPPVIHNNESTNDMLRKFVRHRKGIVEEKECSALKAEAD
jgi:hypothetical protein